MGCPRRWISSHFSGVLLALFLASAAPLTSPAAAQSCNPQQLTCITGKSFLVRAYNGLIVRNGGKCLDYSADVAGSPLFLNDCSVAHALGVRELDSDNNLIRNHVLLLTGTNVIGLKRSGVSTIGPAGPPGFVSPSEFPLEVQNLAGTGRPDGAMGSTLEDQVFALDGDSIILAANRELVAKVQNGRGRNGTPIVVGARHLADSELWDFHATDESGDDPTTAFMTVVPTLQALWNLFGPAVVDPVDFGTVIKFHEEPIILSADVISPDALSGGVPFPQISVPAGVTIRGDRRGTLFGPELWMTTGYEGFLFGINGNDTRITGLRLRGTNVTRDQDEELKYIRNEGVHVPEQYQRTIVDHNDISDWNWAGVRIEWDQGKEESCSATPLIPPETRPNNVRVLRNFIHHNVVSDRGYGVNANSGGFPLIEGNTFVTNRHAIAGTSSTTNTGYRAWSNLVLGHAPLQHGIFHTHDFDMHGTGDNGFCGIAGGYMDLFGNTFFGTDRANYKLRGTNCSKIEIHDNIFLQDEGDAIKFDNILYPWEACSSTAIFVISSHPEQFDIDPHPADHLAVGDFDGDGRQDTFLATGTAFYYAPGGEAEWRLLASGRTDRIGSLLFGDFDGDGRTDVIGKNGNNINVSWGGASEWEKLNSIRAPMTDLAVGNFDGGPEDDIFYADGTSWYVSSGGGSSFLFVNTSSFRVKDLRFGDFNRNGKTDVFGVVSGNWMFSDGATTAWQLLQPRLTNTVSGLVIADFDGDNRDDVAMAESLGFAGYLWKYSTAGVGDWSPVTVATTSLVGVGKFSGNPRADLLFWDGDGFSRSYIGTLPQHYSRQDMR